MLKGVQRAVIVESHGGKIECVRVRWANHKASRPIGLVHVASMVAGYDRYNSDRRSGLTLGRSSGWSQCV